MTDALDALAEAEAVRAVDLALARLVAGLDAEHGGPDPARQRTLALSTALVSRETRGGHSAVCLSEHAGKTFPEDAHVGVRFRDAPQMPELEVWQAHLTASPTVGGPGTASPLVWDGDRLAMRRHWDAEQRVALAVLGRLAAHERAPSDPVRDAFARLFPPRTDGSLDRQALAAAAALRQRVLFVAGGPGTGKTYTAARLLALYLSQTPGARIALAAPTGKAADGLETSVAGQVATLPADLGERVDPTAVTLHKLLGAHPERAGFRHDARNPLPHDLVLVDEGSMVDLRLFDALLAALRDTAVLVILGDPDQLPPVGVGMTFADLVGEGQGPAPPDLAAFCADLGLADVPASPTASPLAASVVELTESRRFSTDSDVGVLAAAVRDGEVDATVEALRARDALSLVEEDPAGAAVTWVLPFARAATEAATPEAALAVLSEFRLLAAVRRGPRGVEGLNAAVEQALRGESRIWWSPYGPRYYPGRPVLVTVNDPDTGLRNGDVGVCWGRGDDRSVVFSDGKTVPFVRLPSHEPAWAMTVHKSQGAEFSAVGVVLPEPATRGAGLLTRELLYTAATRAKESASTPASVAVFGEAAEVGRAVRESQRRTSGLAARLRG